MSQIYEWLNTVEYEKTEDRLDFLRIGWLIHKPNVDCNKVAH